MAMARIRLTKECVAQRQMEKFIAVDKETDKDPPA